MIFMKTPMLQNFIVTCEILCREALASSLSTIPTYKALQSISMSYHTNYFLTFTPTSDSLLI